MVYVLQEGGHHNDSTHTARLRTSASALGLGYHPLYAPSPCSQLRWGKKTIVYIFVYVDSHVHSDCSGEVRVPCLGAMRAPRMRLAASLVFPPFVPYAVGKLATARPTVVLAAKSPW
ncbi:hypothetical protein OTU49_005571 [Cherax quadricarinatus]|uniref:Uncharacterized protein n=1 Tax=Cherax quadricarinatus TaxID=27406 RepID=A0AAW0WWA5_CHEQU